MRRLGQLARALVLVGALLAAAASSTSRVKRKVGLVPQAIPLPRSGQNIYDGRFQIDLNTSLVTESVMHPGDRLGPSNRVARYRIGGAARVRLSDNWDLGVLWVYGLADDAMEGAEGMPAGPRGGPLGAGPTLYYSAPLSKALRLAFSLEVPFYLLPNMEYEGDACIQDYTRCSSGSTDSNLAVGVSLSGIFSVRLASWASLFASAGVGSSPLLEPLIVEESNLGVRKNEGAIAATLAGTFGGGMEVNFGGRWRLLAGLHYVVTSGPLDYGPVAALSLSVSLGMPPGGYPVRRPAPPPPPPTGRSRRAPLPARGARPPPARPAPPIRGGPALAPQPARSRSPASSPASAPASQPAGSEVDEGPIDLPID